MTDSDIQNELDAIERAVHRARGLDTDHARVHPTDFRLPTGRELREMRKRCGLTVAEAAERVDLAESSLSHIEGGHSRPGTARLQQLLRLYRMEWPRGEP